jgi:hypothetical protein
VACGLWASTRRHAATRVAAAMEFSSFARPGPCAGHIALGAHNNWAGPFFDPHWLSPPPPSAAARRRHDASSAALPPAPRASPPRWPPPAAFCLHRGSRPTRRRASRCAGSSLQLQALRRRYHSAVLHPVFVSQTIADCSIVANLPRFGFLLACAGLSWSVDERSLTDAFSTFGTVTEGRKQIRKLESSLLLGNLAMLNLGMVNDFSALGVFWVWFGFRWCAR